MFEMRAVCEKCGSMIDVNSQTIRKENVTCISDGKELEITKYVCEKCGRVHVVQVDDIETKELLRKLTKGVAKMAKNKKLHKELGKKETTKIAKIRTDLAEKRLALNVNYQGKTCIGENGVTFDLEVSVQDGREVKPC